MKRQNMFYYYGADTESSNKPSATIPDQTLPLRTLIERYVRGIPTHQKTPVWDKDGIQPEDYLPDPKTLDLAERQEMVQKYSEELQAYKDLQKQNQLNLEAANALKNDSKQQEPKTEPKIEAK